jgi:hypothetical protein
MSIPLITNFTINQNAPIDDRIVVTNSSARDSIQYKYDGLTVFQTDTRSSWTWNTTSATWSYNVAGNGIYSGSGSLISNTYINLNSISTGAAANTTSNLLGYYSNLTGGSNVYYLNTFAVKKSASQYSQFSFKIQNSLNSTNYSYIEFNPDSTDIGSIAIGNNATEYLRISNSGNLNLWKGNLILWSPTYSASFNISNFTGNQTYTLPLTSGALALYSDVISYINATMSSISLQKVTSFGATSSFPITLNATFSLSQNAKEVISFDNSNYILSGVISATAGFRDYTGSTYTDIFNILNVSGITGVINLEVTCNASGLFSYVYSGAPDAYNRYSRVSKLSASFYWTGSAYVQLGSTSTIYTHAGGPGTSYALPECVFSIFGTNLRFIQSPYTSPPGELDDVFFNSLNTRVYYKINISKY